MTSPWVTLNGRDQCDFEKIDDHNNLGNVKRLMQIKQMGFSTTNVADYNLTKGIKEEGEKFEFNICEIGSLGSEESSYDEDDESPETLNKLLNKDSPRIPKKFVFK